MRCTPSGLWCVQTSNNLDSFDLYNEEMFTTEDEAKARAAEMIAANAGGRSDYVVSNVADALLEYVRSAERTAMSEG